ncbi:2709_t:CDS:2, partial [Rhizophagus irregularis]
EWSLDTQDLRVTQLPKNLILQCFILLTKKNKPCYVPKLEEGQVLSIANSKFAIGPVDNQIDLILTTATILPINVVGTASVSDLVLTTNLGIQFECTIL